MPHQPKIVAILPQRLLARLIAAAGSEFEVLPASANVGDLRGLEAAAYIVHPGQFEKWNPEVAARLTSAIDVHRVAVYVEMKPAHLQRLAILVRAGIRHLLIADLEDSFAAIRHLLDELTSSTLAVEFVRRLSVRFAMVPDGLRRSLHGVLLRPNEFRTIDVVCGTVGIPRRSCDRLLVNAGIASVRRLLQVGRALHAVPLIRSRRLKLPVIAERLNLGSARRIRADISAVLEVPVRNISHMSDATVLSRAEAYVCIRA